MVRCFRRTKGSGIGDDISVRPIQQLTLVATRFLENPAHCETVRPAQQIYLSPCRQLREVPQIGLEKVRYPSALPDRFLFAPKSFDSAYP
jgi:hypothetical protein